MAQVLRQDKIGVLTEAGGIIYKITNNINGKVYIGQTIRSVERRFVEHKTKDSACRKLNRAMDKYGKNNFSIEELVKAKTQEDLDRLEKKYIKQYDAINSGYNIREGGSNGKWHPESIEKMRQSQITRLAETTTGVYQFDLRGNLIRKWRSEREILDETGWKVGDCLTNKRHMRYGFIWLRENNPELALQKSKKCRPKRRKIIAEKGEEIKVFKSLAEASRQLKIDHSGISQAANGRLNTYKSYTWRYL